MLSLLGPASASNLDTGYISCDGTPNPTSDSGEANTETTGDTVTINVDSISIGSQITFNVSTSTTDASVRIDDAGGVSGSYSPNQNLVSGHGFQVVFTATSAGDDTFTLTRQNPPGEWLTWSASCGGGSASGKHILATKEETSSGPYALDSVITFQVTAINTGDVGYNASITDDAADQLTNCSPSNPVTGNGFAAGDVLACEATHMVTQDDLEAGSYENCATAAGTGGGPGGDVSDQACVTVFFDQNAQLETTKTETSSGPYNVGDDITFDVKVENIGNLLLTNVQLSDPTAALSGCSPGLGGSLAPGESLTCTATHTVTQDDVETGSYTNTATGDSDESPADDGEATVTDFVVPGASLTAVKSAGSTEYYFAGETITYTIVVTNTGDVTLTNLTVNDPLTGPPNCDVTTLAPAEFATCTVSYTTTTADLDRGFVENTATATTTETGPVNSNTVKVVDPPLPLELTKSAGQSQFTEDDTSIDYTYTVRNVSGATVTGVRIDDDKIASVSCDTTTLAADAETTCTGTYTIMPVDILSGQITNSATAYATYLTTDDVASNSEEVTVTYVGKSVEEKVDEATRKFLFRRMDRLMSDGPDRARLLRKQADRAFCGSAGRGAKVGRIYAKADDTGMNGFGEIGCSLIAGDRYDLWIEGNYSAYDSDYGDGSFAVGYVGFDWLASDRLMFGLLGQFDWMSMDEEGDNVKGWGWMVGPYVSAELVDNLFFDARFAWGQSDNDVTVNLSGIPFSGNFDTERWLASARLSGNLTNGSWRVTPEIQVVYMEEKRKTFDVSDGGGITTTAVDSERLALGRLTAGPEIAYRFVHGDITIEPQFALRMIWDFLARGDEVSGMPIYDTSPRGAVELGVAFRDANGASARISGKYDGIGTGGGFDAFSVNGWLNFPLN